MVGSLKGHGLLAGEAGEAQDVFERDAGVVHVARGVEAA
jgi:hypothetical protein